MCTLINRIAGYKGQFCEECAEGYFNKDRSPNSVICESCNCNPFGALDGICDEFGICRCKEGFKGEKCSECVKEREFIKNGICTRKFQTIHLTLKHILHIFLFQHATNVPNYSSPRSIVSPWSSRMPSI